MKTNFLSWVTFVALAGLATFANQASAQTFTYTGNLGTGDQTSWTDANNWFDLVNAVNGVPNAAGVTAVVPVDVGGNPVVVPATGIEIKLGEAITIGTLQLDQATTIHGAGTLTVGSITTNVAGNSIDVNLAGAAININTSSQALTFNGTITNNSAGSQTFRNQSGAELTLTGAVDGGAGGLFFRNDNDASVVNFNNTISGSGKVTFARGTFNHNVAMTTTGQVQLGENSPNSVSTHNIGVDNAFGTGLLNIGGGGAVKTIQAIAGTGTKTLDNSRLQLQRDLRFAGSESFIVNSTVYQTSSRSIANDLDAGKTLTLNGAIYAANSADDRFFKFSGTGTTILKGSLDDRFDTSTGLPNPASHLGGLQYSGSGRLILDTGFQSLNGGATQIDSGTVQLGNGGAAVALSGTAINGVAGATLDIKHSTSLTLTDAFSGSLNVTHSGPGTTTLTSSSFGDGSISVTDGTLMIEGGRFAGATITTALKAVPRSDQVIMFDADAAKLMVGQTLTVSGINVNNGTPFANSAFVLDIAPNAAQAGTSIVQFNGNAVSTNTSDGNYTVVSNAGTGTGTASVVANGGKVGGNGVIGGNLQSNAASIFTGLGTIAPGASIGTLTVDGNATLNGVLEIEYNASALQTIDLLAVGGNISLGAGSILDLQNLNLGADLTDPAYVFATYGGTLAGQFGTINGLQAGYSLNYAFGGNSIALVSAVPEPSSLMGLLPFAFAGFIRRRRAK